MPLLTAKPHQGNIRVWVPGCATGEEAYSVAMLFMENMTKMKKRFNIQVFATDIDNDAIEYARHGVYPDRIAKDVSHERLKQFFVGEENTYTVKKQIREMVVFAMQNMVKDPPFSKLDLICCRNVLIYMDTILQKKALPLFHYTLSPGGFLFLGTSETIGDCADRFSSVDTKWKIFKRKDELLDIGLEHPISSLYNTGTESVKAGIKVSPPAANNICQLAERAIMRNYAPPCVVVDEKFDILYFHGETDRYLTLPKGEPSFNILKMAREDLHYKLNTLLVKASKDLPIGFVLLTVTRGPCPMRHGPTGFDKGGWDKNLWRDNMHEDDFAQKLGFRGGIVEGPIGTEFENKIQNREIHIKETVKLWRYYPPYVSG